MMRVEPQPEPSSFEEKVRTPGRRFLETTGKTLGSKGFWDGQNHWRHALADLWRLYGGVCAYTGLVIYPGTGADSVDHFKPKSRHPHLAYEWGNFRLACQRVNACKRDKENILDPFEIESGWFTLDFDTFRVEPHSALEVAAREAVLITIAELKLNLTKTSLASLANVRNTSKRTLKESLNFPILKKSRRLLRTN